MKLTTIALAIAFAVPSTFALARGGMSIGSHVTRPNQGLTLGHAVSSWAYAPPRPPVHYHDTPSYNDPSKFGGQSLGIDP
jgi:hypothetical protein